ncbi:hypothetical protein ACS0TY_026449 [Phlomoides rotata]
MLMLAKKLHPDTNKDDPEAEFFFPRSSKAYEVLKDEEKRQQYDQVGHEAFESGGPVFGPFEAGFNPFEDIFKNSDFYNSIFNRVMGAEDVKVSVELSFMEAVQGCIKALQILTDLACDTCGGSGVPPPGLKPVNAVKVLAWNLRNNAFNGSLTLSRDISQQLQEVNLENNTISAVTFGSGNKITLMLFGNPECDADATLQNTVYCKPQQLRKPYSTSLAQCGNRKCDSDQQLNLQSYECAYPYEGTLTFRAPSFSDLSDADLFRSLETNLWTILSLSQGSVSIQSPFFTTSDYIQMQLGLFPSNSEYFNRSEVQRIGFTPSKQTFKLPPDFGPYFFIGSPYNFGDGRRKSICVGMIARITTGCAVFVLILAALGTYAFRQKRRAEQDIYLSTPFASWKASGKETGGAPQLKGARWFSYDELKKCKSNFSETNQIGSGGYVKVYKGVLSDGQVVAVKRPDHILNVYEINVPLSLFLFRNFQC